MKDYDGTAKALPKVKCCRKERENESEVVFALMKEPTDERQKKNGKILYPVNVYTCVERTAATKILRAEQLG